MLDRETICRLYELGDEFREVAVSEVVANPECFADLMFRWIEQGDETMLGRVSQTFCFLNTGLPVDSRSQASDSLRADDFASGFTTFSDIAADFRLFFHLLVRELSLRDAPDRLLKSVYQNFPGIRADLEHLYPTAGLVQPTESHATRQLMVFVCGQCNLHCPYCFSHDIERSEIPAAKLREVFRWADREGCSIVTPCGGEPLLYSELPLFLRLVREYGMTTYLATNFTADIESIDGFSADIVKRIYVHFTRESLADTKYKETIGRNISFCKQQRIDMSARINLTVPDLQSALGWLDLTAAYGIHRLNIALTIPSRLKGNRFTAPSDFSAFTDVICRMVDHARQLGIALGIAKPLPLCIFPTETARTLLRSDANTALCGIHHENYMNNLSLSTDGWFSPCLGLQNIRARFDSSMTWGELAARFSPGVSDLLNKDVDIRCSGCFLKHRGLCQGFCLSYKYEGYA